MRDPLIVAQIVPTGVGAAVGGYVGDATPATNIIASIADIVISHPNVINGVTLDLARGNVLYVEGFCLDEFFRGNYALREVAGNRIGVILDSGSKDKESYDMAVNTIDALRTVKGINVVDCIRTEKPVGARAVKTKAGAFVGEMSDPSVFLKPAKKLADAGAEAIAIATKIVTSNKDLQLYFKGKSPNPYGGTEAIISHMISRTLRIPSAHAPLLTVAEMNHEMFSGVVDARAGAEAISPAYLGCVLQGLHKAPKPVPIRNAKDSDITAKDLDAVILPYSCMGGVPALAAQKHGIPIIAVKENRTVMKATPERMRLDASGSKVIVADNYLEAAGILAAMKEGIDYRAARRPMPGLLRT